MKLIADTHLHIYPFYDLNIALDSLFNNLDQIDPKAHKVGCLTERSDCDVYGELLNGSSSDVSRDYDIQKKNNSLEITKRNGSDKLTLLPGQQIITSENLEILMLNCADRVSESQSARDTVKSVLDVGGTPVVAWGFGKWLGKRGKIVDQLVNEFGPTELAVGDSTMRPIGWPTPGPYKNAENKGLKILFGSDPLPFRGDQVRPGSYATRIELEADSNDASMIFSSLLASNANIGSGGKRSSPMALAQRMHSHRRNE